MELQAFFAKYPLINECWKSSDGHLHFNESDANLHSRIRNLSGTAEKHLRESENKSKSKGK